MNKVESETSIKNGNRETQLMGFCNILTIIILFCCIIGLALIFMLSFWDINVFCNDIKYKFNIY